MAIRWTVGARGQNDYKDVQEVQSMLNGIPRKDGGVFGPSGLLDVDGEVGPLTLTALQKFQALHLGWSDSRVDPGGPTEKLLDAKFKSNPLGGRYFFVPTDVKVLRNSNLLIRVKMEGGGGLLRMLVSDPSICFPVQSSLPSVMGGPFSFTLSTGVNRFFPVNFFAECGEVFEA